MKKQKTIREQLQEKLWKVPNVTDLRDMVFKSADKFGNKPAFEVRNKDGKIDKISYNQLKQDVVYLGTGLMRTWSYWQGNWYNW